MTTTQTTRPVGTDPAELRARAAERGLSVSEYVQEEMRRVEREAAWERALAAVGRGENFGPDALRG